MAAVHVLTLIVVFVAILVIAVWLMAVTYQLGQVHSRLNTILGVVVDVGEKTAVLDPVISEIQGDLAAGHEAIAGAVQRLKERKGYQEPVQDERTSRPKPHQGGNPEAGAVPAGPPPITFTGY